MALFCFSGFALSVKAYGFASSPKGRAKSTAGSFLITPNTLAMSFTACALSVFASQIHLSQRERQEHCRKLSHYS